MTSRRTAVFAALSISACVAAPMSGTSLILPAAAQSGDYELSAAEQKLSCKQLSGRIQVRIMQIRDYGEHGGSSQLARGLQSAFSKTVGTSAKGVDPDGTHSQDLKMTHGLQSATRCKGLQKLQSRSGIAETRSARHACRDGAGSKKAETIAPIRPQSARRSRGEALSCEPRDPGALPG